MNIITNFGVGQTPASGTATFSAPSQRITLCDQTNRKFLRAISLTDSGLVLLRPGQQAGLPMSEILHALITVNPLLTWPPVITVQPVNVTVAAPNPASFSITATSEATTTITYQWQISSDGGVSWGNVTNGGVYSGATTNALSISNSTGLNAKKYRCQASTIVGGANAGTTNSSAGTLTVT